MQLIGYKMKKTAIVILNWNTRDYLGRFVPLILESIGSAPDGCSQGQEHELIVADNASTDGSLELMEEHFPGVRTIVLDRNYGFTGGYNRALEQLRGQFSYYLLLNSDIEVGKGWIEPLVSWMDSHPECAACAPKLHSYYDRDSFEYAGAAGGLLDRFGYPLCLGRVMGRVEKDSGQYDGIAPERFWVSGACLLTRSADFHSMGGLDDRFFAHMEEIDLCWRYMLHGRTVCVVPESTVWHMGGGTLPSTSPFKLRLNFRNNLLMLDSNLARSHASIFLQRGMEPEKAAARGRRKASALIFLRMLLDGLSAAVYLLTLKTASFKAVIQAHREFRELRRKDDPQLLSWLEEYGDKACLKGLYGGWCVLSSLIWRDKVFSHIRT